ncbi:hypothetical protein KJ877_02115 [bacterium]|nr:hypothetical protein [bacterium]
MNQFKVVVEEIEESDVITFIRVKTSDTSIGLIKSKRPKWLSVGDEVLCKFQEASVGISKDCPGKVSIENTLPVKLKKVRKNDTLCELTLQSGLGDVISLITSRAYDTLELIEGCDANILLRGVDINLEPILNNQQEALETITSRIKDANE